MTDVTMYKSNGIYIISIWYHKNHKIHDALLVEWFLLWILKQFLFEKAPSNCLGSFTNKVYKTVRKWPLTKICIKYRKHWKIFVSFQLSQQIGLVWAVRNNHSPNWHQFYHERPMTIFRLIFKKLPKLKKSLAPLFSNQKRNVGSTQWLKKTHGFES